MKIEISSKELIELIEGNIDVPTIKEKLSGAMLAIANSPEMQKSIEERVMKVVNDCVKDAVRAEKAWGNNEQLKGWAAPLVKHEIEKQVNNQINSLVQGKIADLFKS